MPGNEEYDKEYKEFEEEVEKLKREIEKLKVLNDKNRRENIMVVNGFSENGQ